MSIDNYRLTKLLEAGVPLEQQPEAQNERTTMSKKPRTKPGRLEEPVCQSCGVALKDHLGLDGTCVQLVEARRALRVIYVWATYHGGLNLHPEETARLCGFVLDLAEPPKADKQKKVST